MEGNGNGRTRFQGATVTLAGKLYIVPPLNFRGFQEQETLIRDFYGLKKLSKEEASDPVTMPFVSKYLPIVHAAIRMNYPDVTLDILQDELQIGDMGELSKAIVAALDTGKVGEPKGEAQAARS